MSEQAVREKRRLRGRLIFFALSAFFAAAAALLRLWFAARPDLAERYARGPYRTLAGTVSRITGIVPLSLSELLLLPLILLGCVLFTRFIRRLIKGPARVRLALSGLLLAGGVLALSYSWFVAFHALNYEREPLSASLQLDVRPREPAELEHLMIWLMREAGQARSLLATDADGVASSELDVKTILAEATGAYGRLGLYYPAFQHLPETTPKPVYLSRFWSYTGISGMYNPFFAEANINIDQPSFSLPFSALHEAAHVGGYPREDEANFLAFFSGIHHPLPEYRYAALQTTLSYAANRLHSVDRDRYAACLDHLDAGIAADMTAQRAYWQQFKGPVRQAAEKANDIFLKSQRQTDGVQSYGRMIDLVLAFYERYGDIHAGLQPPAVLVHTP